MKRKDTFIPDGTKWWLTCNIATVMVVVDEEEKILFAPHVVEVFQSQPLQNLAKWMEQKGEFSMQLLYP